MRRRSPVFLSPVFVALVAAAVWSSVPRADIEVELDPSAWRQGHDPQLEQAIAVTLEELKLHPAAPVKKPQFPVYNWPVLR